MSIFTGLFARITGSAIGGWFSTNLLWIALSAFLALGLLTGYYKYTSVRNAGRADLAEEQYNNLRRDFDGLLISVDINEAALQVCRVANAANAAALEHQKQLAQDALTTIKLLQAESVHTVETIHDDGEKLRGQDTECRTVDAPLPDFFIVGLWE